MQTWNLFGPLLTGGRWAEKMERITIATIILLFTGQAFSYEPPTTTPEEALSKGQVAFIGRITEISEFSNNSHISEAIATIKVLHTFYGVEDFAVNQIRMKYASRFFGSIPDHGFPAYFQISRVYLFVLNRPIGKGNIPLNFNPTFRGKIDLAYQFVDDPGVSYENKDFKHRLLSIYGNQVFKDISINKIKVWSMKQ